MKRTIFTALFIFLVQLTMAQHPLEIDLGRIDKNPDKKQAVSYAWSNYKIQNNRYVETVEYGDENYLKIIPDPSGEPAYLSDILTTIDKVLLDNKYKNSGTIYAHKAVFAAARAFVATSNSDFESFRALADEAIKQSKINSPSADDIKIIKVAEIIITDGIRRQGNNALYANDYQNVIKYTKEEFARGKQSKSGYVKLARAYFQLKDRNAAIQLLKEAIVKMPTEMYFVTFLADIYSTNNELAQAIPLLKKLVEAEPSNIVYVRALGNSYYNMALEEQSLSGKLENQKKLKEAANARLRLEECLDNSLSYLLQVEKADPNDKTNLEMIRNIYSAKGNKVQYDLYVKKLGN